MAYAPRHYAQPPYYSWPIYGSTVGYLQYPLQSSDNARDDLSESKSMDIDPDSLHSDDYQPNLPAPQVASRSCSPEGTMGSEHAVASGVLKYPPHTDMDVVAHDDALGDVSDGLQSISSQLTRGAHEGTSETTSASLVTYSPETVIPQQTTSHPASELSGQVATPAPGSSTPQCQAQPRFHVAEERSDTQSLDDLLPKESPPEIKALYDFFESQVLVTLIISQNSSLLPFELPAQCGCAMLGLFRITGVQSEDRIHDDANTGERTLERLWRFQFAWVPGGEVPRPEAQDLPPWWASMPADTPEGHAASIGTPFMIPQYLLFADLLPPEAFEGSAVEQVASGWYCVRCGMLNVQRNLRYQKCGSCLLGNNKRIPPVDADVVRDSHRTASATFPFDKHASGVALKATVASDGMHVLRYEMSNLGAVTHFFTGNADALQEQPSTLFKELQRSVELVFRGFKTGAAAGPHYAYFAGSHSEYEPYAVAWSDVPESIMRTRELMQSRVRTSGEKSLFGINQLVALAWTRSGSRKGYVLSAQESDIVMLCLGADVELSISSKLSTSSARKTPSAQLVRVDAGRETLSDFAPMDCVENRSYASNAGMSMYVFDTSGDPEGDPNVASASAVTSSTASHSRAHRREHESLSVTLVHGDMLLLSGDEYEYTLTRTGMSILLMGSQ
ncbi:hypothetical protein CERSUDRAFT_112809 [Gelatoporia subvermispora B]|uniref:Uncharacterized protein n=1 Tax=Ceriporiopsis subvermispora (strain B) TaxID=914234 RepID=M2RJY3_CERS8|nr:hypothetical protein CERSUDRAFT_112809 [Gelatoporia subvermispora B]